MPFQIERRVLEAAVLESEGEARAAAGSMNAAVEMAIRGFRYQFSHVGPVAVPILERIVGRTEHDAHVRSILDRLPKEAGRTPAAPVDPLTDRELEVLAEVAAGYTNAEIADRLYISKGTVKRHTANIYMKLAAHHRAEAIAKGRALGLIE